MTKQQLRAFLGEHFCGCGWPESAAARLRDILRLHPLHSNREAFKQLVPDDGIEYLILYMLDRMGLTEHGVSVGCAWLTDEGEAVLEALERDGPHVLDGNFCAHGYDIEGELDECPECSKLNVTP